MDEDCLFLNVWAPTNATKDSNLPIMVFVQGGGLTSNSNGYLNGSLLVANSGMNMVVITLNYRVGLLGALASKEVQAGGSLNNGLKDGRLVSRWLIILANDIPVMYVLQWVQDRGDLVRFNFKMPQVLLNG